LSARRPLAAVLGCIALALALSGCSYDYLQHTDRVAYSAGDAVKANLESETINPSKRSMYYTNGLGMNGVVGGSPTPNSSPKTGAPPRAAPASTSAAPSAN
jgi:hypothetical protein